MPHILIVEDERDLASLVSQELRHIGHTVAIATDGPSAVKQALANDHDLIVLDVMLPGYDGLEVLRRVRAQKATPVLMLTARSTELDKVVGLELGADDYLTKPFSMRELEARITAILRRVEMVRSHFATSGPSEPNLTFGSLEIDQVGREVRVGGEEINLTATEFNLLSMLAKYPGRAFSREYLLEEVWGDDVAIFDRTVDSHIQRLRRKLGDVEGGRIETVWGVGYRFNGRG